MIKKILAPIFSTNMVLQRNKPIPFWGKVAPNDTVTLSLNGFAASTVADEEGAWSITAPPMEAAEDQTLIVCDSKDRVKLTGIAIGEVWLAGGQSNMEFPMNQCTEWEQFKEPANRNPRVRFFYTPKVPYRNDLYYRKWDESVWQTVESSGFGDWSSVGYQCAAELADALHITVGVIGCNWGGTSASAWMSREDIMACEDTQIYIKEFALKTDGLPLSVQYEAYDRYEASYNEWNAKCAKLYEENPLIEWSEVNRILGECEWPGPMNMGNPYRPCGLYDQMILEIAPYAIAGFLYYQGESDDHRPHSYYQLFGNMLRNWRRVWKDNELPMMITQLPIHRYSADPDYRNWPIIREAQLRIFEETRNTGLAVIPDCGVFNDIHPKAKAEVAHRLALQALYHVYGKVDARKAMAPIYDYKIIRADLMEIHFKYAEGLAIKGAPDNFEIAGADRVYHTAQVQVTGKNTLTLHAPEVPDPVYARYLWRNYSLPCLYGKNGLPASPFRTDYDDGSDVIDGNATIQQVMET